MTEITQIPERMDRLPWFWWHWWIVSSLGVSWLLDGLQITSIGLIGTALKDVMGISALQGAMIGAVYIAGAVTGSLIFGVLADSYGRKKLFLVTPAVYLSCTFLTAFWPPVWWGYYGILACVFGTGFGIGGEYSAINSAVNEFIPARVRGVVDLVINGTYWLGATAGAILGVLFLSGWSLPDWLGWRLPFVIAAFLGIFIIATRIFLPESPRWLMTHGKLQKAEEIVAQIERYYGKELPDLILPPLILDGGEDERKEGKTSMFFIFIVLWKVMRHYKKRAFLSMSLMTAQAFFYNAIFFTYADTLSIFYGIPTGAIGYFMIPFALGNFLGSALLGKLFDVIGRKIMISLTYALSAILLIITGVLFLFDIFGGGILGAVFHTTAWCVIFFVCSAGASSAYLTISEIFPLEIRALAIAIFYSAGTFLGGVSGPLIFGYLVCMDSHMNDDHTITSCNGYATDHVMARISLVSGYCFGATLMFIASFVEIIFGVNAEGKSLEDIATPLQQHDEQS